MNWRYKYRPKVALRWESVMIPFSWLFTSSTTLDRNLLLIGEWKCPNGEEYSHQKACAQHYVCKRFSSLSWSQCSIVLQSISHLHGVSFHRWKAYYSLSTIKSFQRMRLCCKEDIYREGRDRECGFSSSCWFYSFVSRFVWLFVRRFYFIWWETFFKSLFFLCFCFCFFFSFVQFFP